MGNNVQSNKDLIFLIDKPKEYTSARIVNIIKKTLDIKKAGHSGTLDPKATGLMVIGTGKKTKVLNELLDSDKEYEGIMIIGGKTKSFDTETEVYETNQVSHMTESVIKDTAMVFTGEIEQTPPMYSAVKHKGKPLYKFARKGRELERKPRKVVIKNFDITGINIHEIMFRVVCSKGTYIRTLINDFGEKLGVGAYLKELRRTRIGSYEISQCLTLEQFINKYRN